MSATTQELWHGAPPLPRRARAPLSRGALARRCSLAAGVLVAALAPGARGDDADARSIGLGGCGLLHRLVGSPGAPLAPGVTLQCGAHLAFVGSSLGARHVALQCVRARHAWALGAAQERSDIHTRSRGVLVAQAGGARWRAGIELGVASTSFARYAAWREADIRLGVGVRWRTRGRFAAVVAGALQRRALPQLATAASWRLVPGLQVDVQLEREPGLALRTRAGCVLGEGTPLALLGGFDLVTFATSGGLVASVGPWRFTYATQTHPDLGWSHAWSLDVRL